MRLIAAQRFLFCMIGMIYGEATLKNDTSPKIAVVIVTRRT